MNWNKLTSDCKTPFYVFDLDRFQSDFEEIRRGFGSDIGLCYAMKANAFLTECAAKHADRIEICSMGEYHICRRNLIPPEKMYISGVLKKKEDLALQLREVGGDAIFTAESFQQYQMISDWALEHRQTVTIFLRLSSGTQFGMDKTMIRNIMELRNENPWLELRGIHFFTGTQKKNVKFILKELTELDQFLTELEHDFTCKIPELEYGPGLSVDYFVDKQRSLINPAAFAQIREAISQMHWNGHVTLEMGRAFAAHCGYYVTKVLDTKQNDGRNYCITDGGIHQINYDGQIKGMYQPYLYHLKKRQMALPGPAAPDDEDVRIEALWEHTEEKLPEWTICGSLCTFNDVLCQKAMIADLHVNDMIIFARTGAYSMTEGMALFLSHELPAVILHRDGVPDRIVRKQQELYEWNSVSRTC